MILGSPIRRRAALAAAAGLIGAAAAAGAGAGAAHARPAAGAGAATAAGAGTSRGGVCGQNAAGEVANCPARPAGGAGMPGWARDASLVARPPGHLARLVDTRTWTSGGGNTFPGADAPFGMIQWSPDTWPHRADGGGYTYSDHRLFGYSLTHLSGPGCASAGDIPVLPLDGPLPSGSPVAATTSFTHRGEVAQAGYYSARSGARAAITTAITALPRAALARFTFPARSRPALLIKLRGSQRGDWAAAAAITSRRLITGSASSGGFCNETAPAYGPQHYTVYFALTLSRPFAAARVITLPGRTRPSAVWLTFPAASRPVTIEAKAAISYTGTAGALLNAATLPGWSLPATRARAQAAWTRLLSRVAAWGGTTARVREFYSLLYKTLLFPSVISDADGRYLGTDYRIHALAGGQGAQYSMFSGWDIYHSLAQLQAILDPAAAADMAQSLVNDYAQNHILPQWAYLNTDNYTNVGDPADAIIADYYAFGARHFDTAAALADMLAQANSVNKVRPGYLDEQRYGYLPNDVSYGCCRFRDTVSELLEYDTADQALSFLAAALGDRADAAALRARAGNWVHVFDPATRLLVARNRDGRFVPGVRPATTHGYVEGSAEEYLWDVPNDYAGLFARLGGTAAAARRLRAYLSRPNGQGRYAKLANEFDDGEQFAPDYARDPAGTQLAVNAIRDHLYLPGPYGLPNNDDLGAESSQFIWETLGLYPENPGSGDLVFGTPGFPHVVLTLPSGKTITIVAPGASPRRFYVSALTINGVPVTRLYVPFSALTRGATLRWALTRRPTSWGRSLRPPPSYG